VKDIPIFSDVPRFFGVISISTCHTVLALACEVFRAVELRLDSRL